VDRLLVAVAIAAVAALIAYAVRRRRSTTPPAQVSRDVPSQLDRADFAHPEADWLVAVFTSATCDACAAVAAAARRLAADDVAVVEVGYQTDRRRHERYRVAAVPMVVFADRDGVVRASRLGPATAAELAAALAAARVDM
jgi:protein-disulfide isomerase